LRLLGIHQTPERGIPVGYSDMRAVLVASPARQMEQAAASDTPSKIIKY
jgi:hypothetical protein